MIVYQSTKDRFLEDTFKDDIQDVIRAAYLERAGKRVGRSELVSWRESLVCMAKVLNDDGIPDDCGVAIEFVIPQSGKRIDFIVTGSDENHRGNVIIVELKQWTSALRTDKDAVVRTRLSKGQQETTHLLRESAFDACRALTNRPRATGTVRGDSFERAEGAWALSLTLQPSLEDIFKWTFSSERER